MNFFRSSNVDLFNPNIFTKLAIKEWYLAHGFCIWGAEQRVTSFVLNICVTLTGSIRAVGTRGHNRPPSSPQKMTDLTRWEIMLTTLLLAPLGFSNLPTALVLILWLSLFIDWQTPSKKLRKNQCRMFRFQGFKVHIFWEGLKIFRILYRRFDHY